MGRTPFVWLFALLLLTGCHPSAEEDRSHVAPLTILQSDGTLEVKEGPKLCLLADDALAYEVYPSPDGRALAVETLLMSNLQTLRIYEKRGDGCFREVTPSPATTLWEEAARRERVPVEEIEHPRIRFLRWEGERRLDVRLSGETPRGSFELDLAYSLP